MTPLVTIHSTAPRMLARVIDAVTREEPAAQVNYLADGVTIVVREAPPASRGGDGSASAPSCRELGAPPAGEEGPPRPSSPRPASRQAPGSRQLRLEETAKVVRAAGGWRKGIAQVVAEELGCHIPFDPDRARAAAAGAAYEDGTK